MLNSIRRFFGKTNQESDAGDEKTEHDIHVATCALLVELARIVENFTRAEMDAILSILKKKYGLAGEHADALIAEAEKELDNSVDLWQFASLINQNYSNDEKTEIIETLWQVVYVDGKMDQHTGLADGTTDWDDFARTYVSSGSQFPLMLELGEPEAILSSQKILRAALASVKRT